MPATVKEEAEKSIDRLVVGRSFRETVPTEIPEDAPHIVEARAYNSNMWPALKRGEYKKSIYWATKVVNNSAWMSLALKDQRQKAKEIGGIVRYPWKTLPTSVPELESAIKRYPLLNEVATAMWGLAVSNFKLGNRKEAKKWIRRIIEEVPYHQIYAPDGPGYWNALISWEYNPGKKRLDGQMREPYLKVLEGIGLKTAAPKEVQIRGKQFRSVPNVPSQSDNYGKDIWVQGNVGEYTSHRWQARATYADFDPPLRLKKGQKITINYSLEGSNVLGIQLIPEGMSEGRRGGMIVKRGVGGDNKTITITVPRSRDIWRIAFQYGKEAWGPLGGSVDAKLVIYSVELGSASSPLMKTELQTSDEGITSSHVGGINLDPAMLDLQIKRDGNGVPLPVFQQPIMDMNIEGFLPVIINVSPINVPLLLGFEDQEEENNLTHNSILEPMDRRNSVSLLDYEEISFHSKNLLYTHAAV